MKASIVSAEFQRIWTLVESADTGTKSASVNPGSSLALHVCQRGPQLTVRRIEIDE